MQHDTKVTIKGESILYLKYVSYNVAKYADTPMIAVMANIPIIVKNMEIPAVIVTFNAF